MEKIEEMDRLRSRYIESLEFDNEQKKVKCQGCDCLCPVIKQNEPNRLTGPSGRKRDRICHLQTVIELAEKYRMGCINAPVVGGVMTAPPLRKISDNMLQPDDDKNPTKRRQNFGKILFDQSSKNKNQKISTPLD